MRCKAVAIALPALAGLPRRIKQRPVLATILPWLVAFGTIESAIRSVGTPLAAAFGAKNHARCGDRDPWIILNATVGKAAKALTATIGFKHLVSS